MCGPKTSLTTPGRVSHVTSSKRIHKNITTRNSHGIVSEGVHQCIVSGCISFLIGYTNVSHGRIDGTVPEGPLHFRQIHIPSNQVRGEGVFKNVRMALMVGQARITSYLPEYPIELCTGKMAAFLGRKQGISTICRANGKPFLQRFDLVQQRYATVPFELLNREQASFQPLDGQHTAAHI